ncbi:MAG: S-layer homology domain-containing protein [Paenibacillaceae bacterium]|nr:S-layer homology domain-containing protein [Paenibacillaceae bacterium]
MLRVFRVVLVAIICVSMPMHVVAMTPKSGGLPKPKVLADKKTASLVVHVVDEYGMLWIERTTITLTPLDAQKQKTTPVIVEEINGGTWKRDVVEGTYRIDVQTSIGRVARTASLEAVNATSGAQPTVARIPITIGYEQVLSGVLVGPDGKPLSGSVSIESKDERGTARTAPLVDGKYAVGLSVPGTYRVRWDAEVVIAERPRTPDAPDRSELVPLQTVLSIGEQMGQTMTEAHAEALSDAYKRSFPLTDQETELAKLDDMMRIVTEQLGRYRAIVDGGSAPSAMTGVVEQASTLFVRASKRYVQMRASGASTPAERIVAVGRYHTLWLTLIGSMWPLLTDKGTLLDLCVRVATLYGMMVPHMDAATDVLALTKAHIEAFGVLGDAVRTRMTTAQQRAWSRAQRQLVRSVQVAVRNIALIYVPQPIKPARESIFVLKKEAFEQSKELAQQAVSVFSVALNTHRIDVYRELETPVVLVIDAPPSTSQLSVELAPLGAQAMEGVDVFTIHTPLLSMDIKEDTFGAALQNDVISLRVRSPLRNTLTNEQRAKVPEQANPVDIRYAVNGVAQAVLPGMVRLGLPYVPKQTEDPEALTAVFVSDSGIVYTRVGQYESDAGKVEFMTNRFALYYVDQSIRTFTDTKDYDWALKAMGIAVGKSIMSGKTPTTFDPAGIVTRAAFASLLVRAFAFQTKNLNPLPFKDINRKMWHAQDVAIAFYENLMPGKTDRTFEPDAPITRQEAAEAIANVLRKNRFVAATPLQSGTFRDDALIDSARAVAIATVVREGIFQGNDQGNIRPLSALTRVEVAVMFLKLLRVMTHE